MKERKVISKLLGLPKVLAVVGALVAQVAFAVPTWNASTLPADGNIDGAAGSTIGWGYSINNPDSTLWLVMTGVSANPFANAAPLAIFDLPVLIPGASLNVTFDGVSGLYGLSWDRGAPVGFVNFGDFLLTAEWFDGDPLAGGSLVETATDILLSYSATVIQGSAIPEPPMAALFVLAATILWRRRQRPSYSDLAVMR